MKDLKKRTITAVVLIAILLPVVFFGKIYMYLFAGLMTGFAAYELEHMYLKKNENEYDKWNIYSVLDIVFSITSYITICVCAYAHTYTYVLILVLFIFLAQGFLMIFTKDSTIHTLGNSLITIFYPSIGFSSLAIIRNIEIGLYSEGLYLLLFGVLNCMFTDMFAYFVGCKFGKHKLSKISPKKSWEGSIGGSIFGVVISVVFALIVNLDKVLFPFTSSKALAVILLILLSLALSIIDQIGDLFASKLKRFYGLKDYSQIFPGHGGVLDRFDSYIFVSTAILFYMLLIVL